MNTSCGKLNYLLIYETALGWDKMPEGVISLGIVEMLSCSIEISEVTPKWFFGLHDESWFMHKF